jgi:hypothetical protein
MTRTSCAPSSRDLRGSPDPETLGILLIDKSGILARRGDRDGAIAILGDLALSPDSTLAAEHIAKATLASLIAESLACPGTG